MAPEDPEDQGNPLDRGFGSLPGRCYIFQDMTEEELVREAQAQFQFPQLLRVFLFLSHRVHAVISPETLGGRFNDTEKFNWVSQQFYGSRSAVLWDVADLSGALYCQVPYFQTNPEVKPEGKPFNLTMSVSHIQAGEGARGIAPASSSNLMRVHREAFAAGRINGGLCDYIAEGNADTELPVTAFVMEIPGEFPDEWIQGLNHFADGNNMLEYKHIARFRRPDLATALQSAISRVKTPGVINTTDGFNSSSVVTNEKGPKGKPIVVSCYPSWNKIILAEDDGNLGNSPIPTRTILIRPMFFRRPCDDENAEHLT